MESAKTLGASLSSENFGKNQQVQKAGTSQNLHPSTHSTKHPRTFCSILPKIHEALVDYPHIYEQNYGVKEKSLVPYIIASFLDTNNGIKSRNILRQGITF
tara:strand:+ start:1314 stop:1616 length:303 start_codon:yes stop_codon:yes gene_type:complete